MDPTRFDTISKLFASRRTRRGATAGGLAGAPVGARAFAQDATPAVGPWATVSRTDLGPPAPEMLYVQPFDGGTWAPKAGEDDVYTLTLTGAAAHTVYFSDRPERIVGLAENQQFLDGLGFSPNNPPNAAIVAPHEDGDGQEILVIELLNPAYDADAGTLTYDARVLADYGKHDLAHLARQQQDYEIGETFGAGSLFIDDGAWYSCTDRGIDEGPMIAAHCYYTESGEPAMQIYLEPCDFMDNFSQCKLCQTEEQLNGAAAGQICWLLSLGTGAGECTYDEDGPTWNCYVRVDG